MVPFSMIYNDIKSKKRDKLSYPLEYEFLMFKCRLGHGKLETIETIVCVCGGGGGGGYIFQNCKNRKT